MPTKSRREEQILRVLRRAESGARSARSCPKHGISDATFYIWRNKYASLILGELRQLREKNGKFRRLVTNLSLNRHILQEDCPKEL